MLNLKSIHSNINKITETQSKMIILYVKFAIFYYDVIFMH